MKVTTNMPYTYEACVALYTRYWIDWEKNINAKVIFFPSASVLKQQLQTAKLLTDSVMLELIPYIYGAKNEE